MNKKVSRCIALVMLIVFLLFLVFALTHPEASFPWENTISYTLYGVYLVLMIVLFIAPFKNK